MKRLAFFFLLAYLASVVFASAAAAHPLGNFTTNTFTRVEASGDRLYVLYVVDLAEIPTYQARSDVRRLGEDAYGRDLASRVARGLEIRVEGERRPLRVVDRRLVFPQGVGGLRTTRLEAVYEAGRLGPGAAQRLSFADANFADRIGWREVVVSARNGATLAGASGPAKSISDELRRYPEQLLQDPLDVTNASARVVAGTAAGEPPSLRSEVQGAARPAEAAEDGFAALVSEQNLGAGVILLSLLAAMFWGAAHALTPGHGKAVVAAYLVGTRGNARHALLLGLIVTVTHTIGVFALGLVTLALSEFIVPEQLYPWLNLVSALLVVAVGVTVFRYRVLGWLRRRRAPAGGQHGHDHDHDHHHGHDHGHGHHHHGPGGHTHVPPAGSGLKGLVAVGISGGLLPCPTALVVLLAAISLQRVAYGLVLIVAFSVGLASVIAGIGLLAVGAKRTFSRMSFDGPVVRALPAASALVIVVVGLAMTLRALPSVS